MPLQRLLLLFLLHSTLGQTPCPKDCICDLDDPMGRIRVTCDKGGRTGPLDLSEISHKTEVLLISAPEDNMNSLMIGPIFSTFQKLQEIHITRSNVPEIGEHSFWQLLNLEVLNLRENNISTILDTNFLCSKSTGLPKLEKLYLDENRIDRLSSGTFRYLLNLKVLSLSNNGLDELVTRVFEKLSKLQELNLSGNPLRVLNSEAFVDIQNLKVLQCRNCGLKTINNGFFTYIPHLNILDFGENEFTYIAPTEFNDLPNLISLWLDGNKIDTIQHKTFSAQTQLKKLNLAQNKISHIANTGFGNLSNVLDLNLGYNELKEIDVEVFGSFGDKLKSLELSGNELSTVDTKMLMMNLKRLEHLALNEMGLSDLPYGLFEFNRELTSLSLSKNYFTFFPIGALSPIPKLNTLDFSKNKLHGLDWPSLQRLESIETVNFAGNPWSCDLCHIVPMLIKMNSTLFLQNTVCKTPYYLKGRKLGDLQLLDLRRCTQGEGITGDYFIQEGRLGILAAVAGILLLVLTVISLLAGICYTRRHARHYYTNEEKRQDQDPICETTDLVFLENGEISFQFPMDKKISIATIDDMKKDPDIQANGT